MKCLGSSRHRPQLQPQGAEARRPSCAVARPHALQLERRGRARYGAALPAGRKLGALGGRSLRGRGRLCLRLGSHLLGRGRPAAGRSASLLRRRNDPVDDIGRHDKPPADEQGLLLLRGLVMRFTS